MFKLTERDCVDIKDEVLEGRLTVGGMWVFLVCSFIISSIVVGVSYAVSNANTVGWDTLSQGWHMIFFVEVILFILHIIILISCWANKPFNQKILSVSAVVCAYRIAFEPYFLLLMFSKDGGTYEFYYPIVLVVIICALTFHVVVFRGWIKSLKTTESNPGIFDKFYLLKFFFPLPVLFFLVTAIGSLVRNGTFGDHELTFLLFLNLIVTFGLMVAVCEFIIASYCIFRFPSFSVNAPKLKKKQYVKQSKSKKKKKKRR